MFGFMAALAGGAGRGLQSYVDSTRYEQERARRERLDQGFMQRAAREQADWERENTQRQGLEAAGATVVPTSGELYQPAVDDDGNTMPPNPTAGMQRIGNGPLMTPTDAATAVAAQNTMPARLGRQSQYLTSIGQVAKAKQYSDAADHLEKEGHLDFLDENFARLPTAEQIGAGKATFSLAGVDKFNGVGSAKIPQGAQGQAFLTTLPTGQQVTDFRLVDATGNPIAGIPSARQFEQFYGMDRGQRRAAERQAWLDKTALDDKAASRADKEADNARADKELGARTNYWNAMAGAAGVRAEKTGSGGAKVDHFDDKEKDAARKPDVSVVSFDDESGKAKESPHLRTAYIGEVNRGLESGMSPSEAAEAARSTTLLLRDKAEAMAARARAADPKSTLTAAQAAQRILDDYRKAQRQPSAPPTASPKAAVVSVPNPMQTLNAERSAPAPAAPPKSASVPAAAAAAALPPSQDAIGRTGAALDAARTAAQAATASLQRYGVMQRAADPQGFAAAQAAVAAASATRERAEQDYRAAVAAQPEMTTAAFGRPRRP